MLAKAFMSFTKTLHRGGAIFQAARINPGLDLDMGLGLNLQGSFLFLFPPDLPFSRIADQVE